MKVCGKLHCIFKKYKILGVDKVIQMSVIM